MIYAGDQWIQLPTKDLYDTQMMAIAINAAKDMYEKGQQEMKDFKKEYGDFLTPITADQDWYNQNVTGKVRDVVNALYAQGIDPLRNAQGRAIIAQTINNMPVGEIAKKRVRAKNAEEYYKNMAALRLNDKYNEDFSIFLEEDPNQWAPDSVGVTSPTVFKTLKDATNDWYNNRTPRDLTPEEKKALGLDPRYKYTGYFDSDLMNVAKGNTPGWQGTPISNYYRHLAEEKLKDSGIAKPTAEQIEAVLQRDIANAQQEWLVGPTQGKADEFEVLKQQLSNSLATQRQGKALDYYYKMLEDGADIDGDGVLSKEERSNYARMKAAMNLGKLGGYAYDPSTGNMVSPDGQSIEFTDYRQMTSTLNRNRRIQENMGSYIQQMIDSEQAHIDLYNKYLKENRTGYKETGNTVTQSVRVPGMMGYTPVIQTEYTPKQKTSKHTEAEMKRLRTLAREAQQKIGIYKTYLNSDGSVNYDKLTSAGYLDQNGAPTEYFTRELNKLNKISQSLPEDQRRKRADDTYMLYAGDVPSPGTEAHNRLVSDFAGTNKVKVPGLPNEMRKVNLNHYTLSAVRRGDITGANVYDKNSDVKRAQQWLRTNKVEAYVDDESVNDAFVPNASGTRMNNDLFGEALVDKKYIDRMCADLNIKSKEAKDRLLESLGIVAYEKQTTVPETTNDIDYKWVTYYSIPITKIYDSGVIQGDRNVEFRKARHGQANATAAERNSYAAGMQSTLTTR